jgi:ParB family transcriptional regulator, chromosome partitioning protein
MPEIIHVPASMLSVSPLNVRKQQDEEANLRLRAHIVARGLLQNLIGIPVPHKKGCYEVTAGGRRLTQIHAAIAANELDPGYLVPLLVMNDRDDAEEDSLAENYHRLNMNPAEECIAFQAIIQREKRTPADIAKRWGLKERYVLGRLRLAGLADSVFDALREGRITLDVASAYAATTDRAAQEAVFQDVARQSYGVHPDTIRRRVQEAGYTAASWKVRLISREDYLAGGGQIAGDLFSDVFTETWLDRELVDDLARDRLEAVARDTRETGGFAEVRIVEDERDIWSEVRNLEILIGTVPEPTDDVIARKAEIEAQLGAFEARMTETDSGVLTDVDHSVIDGLRDELANLENPAPLLSDAQKARAIAFIYPTADGKVYLHNEIYAEPLPAVPSVAGERDQPPADTHVEEPKCPVPVAGDTRELPEPRAAATKAGISQRLASELAIQKTELIAVHVANDPHFALDLGVFIMADRARMPETSAIPSELRASNFSPAIPDFVSTTQAAAAWADLTGKLDISWTRSSLPAERFDAFRVLDEDAKAAWLGWCIARTLTPVEQGREGAGFLDHLGLSLGIDAAAWWRPTAENYFDRVPKSAVLDAFDEVGGNELVSRYATAKKADLASAAEKLFRGDTIVEAEIKEKALAWLPKSMLLGAVPTVEGPGGEETAAAA